MVTLHDLCSILRYFRPRIHNLRQSLITQLVVAFKGQQLVQFVQEQHRLQTLRHRHSKKLAELFCQPLGTIHNHKRPVHDGKAVADLPDQHEQDVLWPRCKENKMTFAS